MADDIPIELVKILEILNRAVNSVVNLVSLEAGYIHIRITNFNSRIGTCTFYLKSLRSTTLICNSNIRDAQFIGCVVNCVARWNISKNAVMRFIAKVVLNCFNHLER